MRTISLGKSGLVTMVDDCDHDAFKDLSISAFKHGNTFYARISCYDKEFYRTHRKTKLVRYFLHREVMGLRNLSVIIDHIDGNGLNNQRSNLRVCTHSQNMGNRRRSSNGTSRFKGVSFHKRDKIFSASIGSGGKRLHLGNFNTEEQAAIAYNSAAVSMFGEFSKLNKI